MDLCSAYCQEICFCVNVHPGTERITSHEEDLDNLILNREEISDSSEVVFCTLRNVKVSRSMCGLRVRVDHLRKVNMKIISNDGMPVYLRQFNVDREKDVKIDLSDWVNGDYSVVFSASGSREILRGRFKLVGNV